MHFLNNKYLSKTHNNIQAQNQIQTLEPQLSLELKCLNPSGTPDYHYVLPLHRKFIGREREGQLFGFFYIAQLYLIQISHGLKITIGIERNHTTLNTTLNK